MPLPRGNAGCTACDIHSSDLISFESDLFCVLLLLTLVLLLLMFELLARRLFACRAPRIMVLREESGGWNAVRPWVA